MNLHVNMLPKGGTFLLHADTLCQQKIAASGSIDVLEMDVTNSASIRQAAATVDGEPIDILLNTAGIIGVPNQTAGNMDYKSWAEVLNINTMGPLRVSEQLVENVARSKRNYKWNGLSCR
jgi:NAD(P)-dependent dehydrogenase (short-subunit alcohol dehydrogenase family)